MKPHLKFVAAASLLVASLGQAQLTKDQREQDMKSLGGLFQKRYAPYEWKKQLFGFDLLKLDSWVARAGAAKDDLDFYEVLLEYVGSLNDSHDGFEIDSDFIADLGMTLDLYDGRVLIDWIDRAYLPTDRFPFEIGDEVERVDGVLSGDLVSKFSKYAIQANPRSTQRRAAFMIAHRDQAKQPRAHEIGANAIVDIRRRRTGALERYTIGWIKSGTPQTQVGPVSPFSVFSLMTTNLFRGIDTVSQLRTSKSPVPKGELGNGRLEPVFDLPGNFAPRLGRQPNDRFYSGTFQAGQKKIGFIRIPTYDAWEGEALKVFQAEIAYFEGHTDGLIVDEMRNPGGDLCYGEDIVASLIPRTFRPLGYEIRATLEYVKLYRQRAAEDSRYQTLADALEAANKRVRGMTDAVPLCNPDFAHPPAKVTYTKPLILLMDEFSMSTADSVPAMIQDNHRGLLVGMRTNGAGGSNSLNTRSWLAGQFSEGYAGVTLSLMVREKAVTVGGYPATKYIENVGVQPDVALDYMTRDNLLQRGKPFFDAVTAVMIQQIP